MKIAIIEIPVLAVFKIQCFYHGVNESQGRTRPDSGLKVSFSFSVAARLLSYPDNLNAFISWVSSKIRTVVWRCAKMHMVVLLFTYFKNSPEWTSFKLKDKLWFPTLLRKSAVTWLCVMRMCCYLLAVAELFSSCFWMQQLRNLCFPWNFCEYPLMVSEHRCLMATEMETRMASAS